MKTSNVTSLMIMLALFSISGLAYSNDYLEAMRKSIDAIYHASEIPQLQQAVNTLERIGAAESSKWEPQYYVAFGYLMLVTHEKDAAKKDAYLDHAMSAIEKAKALVPHESEIIALEGFVYMLRVTVDPAARGPEFAPKALQTFSKAASLNPENPRALALMARMQYGSAQFFGTSTSEACALAEKSLEKFEAFKPESPLTPAWGKKMAEDLRQQCR